MRATGYKKKKEEERIVQQITFSNRGKRKRKIRSYIIFRGGSASYLLQAILLRY